MAASICGAHQKTAQVTQRGHEETGSVIPIPSKNLQSGHGAARLRYRPDRPVCRGPNESPGLRYKQEAVSLNESLHRQNPSTDEEEDEEEEKGADGGGRKTTAEKAAVTERECLVSGSHAFPFQVLT